MTRRGRSQPKPRRIIRAAIFGGAIGPVTIEELLVMPEDQWGTLRDRLTDGRGGRPNGLSAACMLCGHPVYIQAHSLQGIRRPGFAHFGGADPGCPWHHGQPLNADAVRAAQYNGQQESEMHRRLCEQIEALAKLDERYARSAVSEYLPPTASAFGRYPDVYVEWRGFPPFAVEFQLSNTFQTEISARGAHYEREQVGLIWVLYGVDPTNEHTPQSFRDIIRRHRGNAFVLDRTAVRTSHAQRTLVLSCYLKNDEGGFDEPVPVRVDALVFPRRGLPYLEDRVARPLVNSIAATRRPWFDALNKLSPPWGKEAARIPEVARVLGKTRRLVPRLSSFALAEDEEFIILRLIAVVFSVLAAANDRERNYATAHPNVRAMLNTFLNGSARGLQRYALLLETLVARSHLAPILNGSVGRHVARAKRQMEGNLCLEGEPEWDIVSALVPEIFNPVVREQLRYLDALPIWAR